MAGGKSSHTASPSSFPPWSTSSPLPTPAHASYERADVEGKYPGRKELPSMRRHLKSNTLPESSHLWISDRQQRDQKLADCPPELWLIHGKLYDLDKFMDAHPGGREWLELTRGTDCTVEFETHHLDEDKANKVLQKYYVRDADPARCGVAAYSFAEDGFYKTLKRQVFLHLKEQDNKWGPSKEMHVLSVFAVALWCASFIYLCAAPSFFRALLAGICLNPMLAVGHNFFHQRNTWLRHAWDLTCFSSHQWRISHAISHHNFPNQDVDVEGSVVEPWMTFIRNQRPNLPGVVLLWFIFNILIAPLEYTRRCIDVVKGRDKVTAVENIIPLLQLSALVVCAGPLYGLGLLITMQWVCNLLLVIISTPVHRSAYAWSVGCEAVVPPAADYGVHTVLATNDFLVEECPSLAAKLFLFASFNDHVTHHLFPTVDLSKQRLVRPIFLDLCQKFNVPYRVTRFPEMLRTLFMVLRRQPHELIYFPG